MIGQNSLSPFITMKNKVERHIHVDCYILEEIMFMSTEHGYITIGKPSAGAPSSTPTPQQQLPYPEPETVAKASLIRIPIVKVSTS